MEPFNLYKCNDPKALRAFVASCNEKIDKLPPNASDDVFCSLAYDALDAEKRAEELEVHKVNKRLLIL